MRRFLAGTLAILMWCAVAVCAEAAPSDLLAVKVTILATLSVDITETEINLGSVGAGTTTVSASGVTVTNTGSGINETYSLSLTNPGGWTASQTAPGAETYVLNAAFDSDGTLSWDVDDQALSTAPVACTGSKFAGDQNGVSVPRNAVRKLWFQFMSPTSTSIGTQQSIAVTITAQAG